VIADDSFVDRRLTTRDIRPHATACGSTLRYRRLAHSAAAELEAWAGERQQLEQGK
jgi:hypothetical protein